MGAAVSRPSLDERHGKRFTQSLMLPGVDRRWAAVLGGLFFVAITAGRFALGDDPANAFLILYVLPIALLAIEFGLVAGIAGAALAIALFAGWQVVEGQPVTAVGYVTRATAFLVVGAWLGLMSDKRGEAETRSARWFEMANAMLCELDLKGCFTRLNDEWTTTLGYSERELRSRPLTDFVHPDELEATIVTAARLVARPSEVVDLENRIRAKDGSWHWLLWSARSDERHIYAVAKDISGRKAHETAREQLLERTAAMARTDALTGLPNRRAWDEQLYHELAHASRHGHTVTVAVADIDHFKRYNDTFGHQAGDALLRDVGNAWWLALRLSDFIARYGGDEFAILLPACPPEIASQVVQRMRDAMPSDHTCSVGLAIWDGDEAAESVVARADAALYEAKRGGRDQASVL